MCRTKQVDCSWNLIRNHLVPLSNTDASVVSGVVASVMSGVVASVMSGVVASVMPVNGREL